jgi:hypothetical protein
MKNQQQNQEPNQAFLTVKAENEENGSGKDKL